jgi:hypothetical protein
MVTLMRFPERGHLFNAWLVTEYALYPTHGGGHWKGKGKDGTLKNILS